MESKKFKLSASQSESSEQETFVSDMAFVHLKRNDVAKAVPSMYRKFMLKNQSRSEFNNFVAISTSTLSSISSASTSVATLSPSRTNFHSSVTDSQDFEPAIKRRRPTADKGKKGLRQFSTLVCEKVKQKVVTTYNEVANELVDECGDSNSNNSNEKRQNDNKNIRRRVYDVLNVLMAADVILKEHKQVRWLGFVPELIRENQLLQDKKRNLEKRTRQKSTYIKEQLLQLIMHRNLVRRNKEIEQTQDCTASQNSHIQLPFILVSTSRHTEVDCSISQDKQNYVFTFDSPFEIYDDSEVLKRIGIGHGNEVGSCSAEDLKDALSFFPDSFKPLLEEAANCPREALEKSSHVSSITRKDKISDSSSKLFPDAS